MTRQIVVTAPRQVSIIDGPDPALKPQAIRVAAHYMGISAGTELNTYRGGVNWHTGRDENRLFYADSSKYEWKYPATLGYATIGRVIEIGEQVKDVRLGQMVFTTAGHCTPAVAGPDRYWAVPDGQDPRKFIFYQLVRTALNITQHAKVTMGDTVAIFGAGIVGLIALMLIRRTGAGRVIVFDPLPLRRDMARKLGADVVLDPTAGDPAYMTREHNEGQGADVVVELSANDKALQACPRVSRVRGRVILGSMPNQAMMFHFGQETHFNAISITGANVMCMPDGIGPGWDMPRRDAYARRLTGELDTLPLISHEFEFEQAAQAYQMYDTRGGEIIAGLFRCPASRE